MGKQYNDLYYLTGFIEPESIAVLISGRSEGEFILFNRERDSVKELWHGERVGQERACSEFGADQAFAISEVDKILPQLLAGRDNVYFKKSCPDSKHFVLFLYKFYDNLFTNDN